MRTKERYDDKKPAGVYSSGYCGYLFFEPDDDDRYTCDFVICYEYPHSKSPNGCMRADYRRHNVHFTPGGRAYVWRDRSRVYLDNVIRTDY